MNWFSLFAMILLVAQTSVPVPRHTPDSPAATGSTIKSQTQNDDAPTAQLLAFVDPTCPTKDQCSASKQSGGDATHSVNVGEFPPVSISKDWTDRSLWVFNFLLVIVGGAQAVYVAKTLAAIKEQAKFLKRQNDMIVAKERARLRVDLVQLPKEPEDFPAFIVKALVTISGSTEAAIRKTAFKSMVAGPHQIPRLPTSVQEMRGMPSVIRAADAPIEVRDFAVAIGGFPKVFTGASTVYAKGAIHYTDVFDGKWVFRFSRRYQYLFFPDSKIIGGGWEAYGEEGDNGEYPEDAGESQNPN
jgi:hypothetical protein